jgi:hypothetical protein
MQTQHNHQDNRAPGIRRVALNTLVELCGQEPDTPAFEGHSLNVSGRGMLIESEFIPAVKTPLVMRFEHEGREVVVEGLVAWRQTENAGGRFGVRFTALDSKSVVVLKELCGHDQEDEPESERTPAHRGSDLFAELDESETPASVFTTTVGAPMKLHIDGLAAPMKARVVEGKTSRLRVGSQLDFLKLGRPVQVEDLSLGLKRAAQVHTVDVRVDAASGIPQLVVTLRWDGQEDTTPEPTVVSKQARDLDEGHDAPRKSSRRPTTSSTVSVRDDDELEHGDEDDDEYNTAEALLKSRVALWATALSRGIKSTSEQVASVSAGTTRTVQGWLKRKAERPRGKTQVRSTRSLRPEPSVRERSGRVVQGNRARANAAAQKGSGVTVKRSHVIAAGATALCVGLGFYVLGQGSAPKTAANTAPRDVSAVVASMDDIQPALPAEGSPRVSASGRQPLDTEQQLRADTNGIVANVPLFGPTQMATTEAALDPDEPVAAAPVRRGGVDEVSLAKDESFSDKVVAEPSDQSSQRVFQVGRMNLPVIHRLRLDAPGDLLQGEKTPNGFSVLIPGRKVMETGASIAGRDARITQVTAKNTPAGARITFRFGKDIPGYKARLRNDYVEFFINSP